MGAHVRVTKTSTILASPRPFIRSYTHTLNMLPCPTEVGCALGLGEPPEERNNGVRPPVVLAGLGRPGENAAAPGSPGCNGEGREGEAPPTEGDVTRLASLGEACCCCCCCLLLGRKAAAEVDGREDCKLEASSAMLATASASGRPTTGTHGGAWQG